VARALPVIILASLLCCACGTKGPLYIPEQAYPQPSTPSK